MTIELGYSVTITGASFLFYELKQVVGLKILGLTESQIKKGSRGKSISISGQIKYYKKSAIGIAKSRRTR